MAGLFCLTAHAQTATWVGGSSGNVFNVAANWNPASVPNGGSADLVFSTTSNTGVGFNSLPVSVNSLTFNSSATNQFFLNGNGGTLTVGAGGLTTQSGSGGVVFNFGINVALGVGQTWSTAANVTVQSNVSGSGMLTKTGSGYLALSGSNSYTGGTTVTAGALYLGSTNSGTGTVTVGGGGTLGAVYYDTALSNNVTLASGATLGGSLNSDESELDLTGSVTLANPTAVLNVAGGSKVFMSGSLAAASSTALTVGSDGTGIAILAGTQTNVANMIADNAGIVLANAAALPTTSIAASNGGYIGIGTIGGGPTPPTVGAVMALITDKAGFNGTIGFDTDEESAQPAVYSADIDLSGFTSGNVRLGSFTSATLTGTITPVAQSYDFGGYAAQDGLLVVKSILADHGGATGVTVVSPSISGGAPQNGLVLALQGANTFTGNVTVSYSSLLLDSASALPAGSSISLGNYSYAGYTETAGFADFAAFASRISGYQSTSILGIDSHDVVDAYVDGGTGTAQHTITGGAINLGGFSSIYLGTLTGATISSSTVITTPSDGTLRLVNMGDSGGLIINRVLNHAGGLVAGMTGSEGAVILAADNSYSGGTTLQGGQILVGDTTSTALGSGAVTVSSVGNGDVPVLGTAMGSASLANNISVAESLQVGTGDKDDTGNYAAGTTSLTLSGVISGAGRLTITGPTTLSGANTYTGGTVVMGNTTVSNDTGLGTGFVNPGYSDTVALTRSTLTFATSAPSIGFLADAGQFNFGAGTGNLNFTGTSPTLTINQAGSTVGSYSGNFTGNVVALVKNGSAQLALTGNNAGQISSATVNAGSLAIGDGMATSATFSGNVTLAGGGLFFRPGSGQTLAYGGSITGTAGGVTVNGHSSAVTNVTGGSSTFTGNTTINSGTLRISGDNLWSSVSATTVGGGATLRLDGDQTIRNLSGFGSVNLATGGKTMTVNSAGNTTFGGVISGSGGLTKTGSAIFTLTNANTYAGSTLVSGGTLVVNNALTSPLVTVDNGATFGGTGTLHDLALNGTYAPGNSAAQVALDNLTMSSTGILLMEIGGTTRGSGYDALNIANAFTADGTLSVSFINSFSPVTAATFNLFDFVSLTGTFDTINLPTLTAGLSWDTSSLYSTGELSITGTAVPEPSTYAAIMGALVLTGAVILRRRRG